MEERMSLWQFYKSQHRTRGNQIMHVIGIGLIVVGIACLIVGHRVFEKNSPAIIQILWGKK